MAHGHVKPLPIQQVVTFCATTPALLLPACLLATSSACSAASRSRCPPNTVPLVLRSDQVANTHRSTAVDRMGTTSAATAAAAVAQPCVCLILCERPGAVGSGFEVRKEAVLWVAWLLAATAVVMVECCVLRLLSHAGGGGGRAAASAATSEGEGGPASRSRRSWRCLRGERRTGTATQACSRVSYGCVCGLACLRSAQNPLQSRHPLWHTIQADID